MHPDKLPDTSLRDECLEFTDLHDDDDVESLRKMLYQTSIGQAKLVAHTYLVLSRREVHPRNPVREAFVGTCQFARTFFPYVDDAGWSPNTADFVFYTQFLIYHELKLRVNE